MGTNGMVRAAMWFCVALLAVAATPLPAVADNGSVDCSPAVCTSPILGPAHHLDVETR
jgi:hypothetical protein